MSGLDQSLDCIKREFRQKIEEIMDLTERTSHAISPQAGPGEAGSRATSSVSLSDDAARALGLQLASIGDQLHRERTCRHRNRPPALPHLLRPARAAFRALLRDVTGQVWGLMSLSTTVKTRFLSMTEQRGFHQQNWTHLYPVTRSGWTTGAVATVALVALCCTLWIEWEV